MCILRFMKMNVGVRITVMLVLVNVNAALSTKSQVKGSWVFFRYQLF